jgi:hypothetical protein
MDEEQTEQQPAEPNQDYLLGDAIEDYVQDYLHQTFLVDCLLKVSRKIVANERVVREALDNADSFIEAEAWINCAKEAIKLFEPFCRKN